MEKSIGSNSIFSFYKLRIAFILFSVVPLYLFGMLVFQIISAPTPNGYISKSDYLMTFFSVLAILKALINLILFWFVCFLGYFLLKKELFLEKNVYYSFALWSGSVAGILLHPNVFGIYTWPLLVGSQFSPHSTILCFLWGWLQPQIILTIIVLILYVFAKRLYENGGRFYELEL